jgi:hypothetical protein
MLAHKRSQIVDSPPETDGLGAEQKPNGGRQA